MVDVQYSPVHNILPNAYLKAWKVEQFTFHFFTGILFLAILLRYFQHFSRTYWKLILFSLERFLIGPGWMKGKWKKVSPFPGSFAWKSHKKCPIFHTQVCNSQEKLRNTNITCAVCRENVSWRNWRLSRLFVNNQMDRSSGLVVSVFLHHNSQLHKTFFWNYVVAQDNTDNIWVESTYLLLLFESGSNNILIWNIEFSIDIKKISEMTLKSFTWKSCRFNFPSLRLYSGS